MAASGNSTATFAEDFARVRGSLSGASLPWIEAMRVGAMTALEQVGFPTVRNEDWKYTNVSPALRDRLAPVLAGEVAEDDASWGRMVVDAVGADQPENCLVFVDGSFRSSLSRVGTTKGLKISSLRESLGSDSSRVEPLLGKYLSTEKNGFAALNTAFLDDGAVVEITAGALVEKPIHVVYLSTLREQRFVTHPRTTILAGAGSSALVVEHHLGQHGARYLANVAAEIVLNRGASLGHVRVQQESSTAFHVARLQVEQAAGSNFSSHAFGLGAALSRTEIAVKLAGEEAECHLKGLYAVDGSRHVDHHLMVDHAAPRTRSNQVYKGVLEDSSRGVFTGRVLVRPNSQKIDAKQSNPSLLLGRGAVAETRPQLEIYADDVACTHGATIGRLDEDSLFYLLSRGIEPRTARRILVSGFAAEVVEGVADAGLRTSLTELVAARMEQLGQGESEQRGAAS